MSYQITTRFAPSPTGAPHIGNIRTAIFAWVYARSHKGRFLLRIEDTDRSREVSGATEAIIDSLEWLKLDWDQNPKFSNLIFQSQRLAIYQKYAEELVKKGCAYVCTCSEERLKELRERQIAAKQPPKYDGCCRGKIQNSKFKIQNYVIRLKVPHEGQTEFFDIIRGKVKFENNLIDDQVLLKSDGYPTYHLANVVDDHLMGVTHVLRAEEWLSSTPKHLLLYKFFGWKPPRFAHLPMILGKDRSKLSKRHRAVSLLEYKKQGYLQEAIFNYLILLGWRPQTDQEIFSRLEIIKQFSLERVQKSPAIFDQEKLDWLNGWYIRQMSASELLDRLIEYGQKFDENKTRSLKI
ncbi:MAG: glutamate--tRNA ligase, partial [Patescibacteria group bacterium]